MFVRERLTIETQIDANSRNNSLMIVIFGCLLMYITTIVFDKVFFGREDRAREGTIPQQGLLCIS